MEEKSVQGCSAQTPLFQELFEVQICILRKHLGSNLPCAHAVIRELLLAALEIVPDWT